MKYWRRILNGDANTKYFHVFANGRCRKCVILWLQSEQRLLLCQSDIVQHVYEFYIQVMGSEEPKLASLRTDKWAMAL